MEELEETQLCSNCIKDVPHNPRYPKYICHSCQSKEIKDLNGTIVGFSNIGMSGGLRVSYYNENNETIKEDSSQRQFECYIDGKSFIAQAAYFGGIVIQKAD